MNILHIDSSILGGNSVSRTLSAAILAKQTTLYPGATITTRDLIATPAAHLSPAIVGAWFGHTPTDETALADLATGEKILQELFDADIIVIGAPMYNFSIPSQLKAWFDRVLRAGKTFKYGENGAPIGLLPATKKVLVASARGGMYSNGAPIAFLDHQETLIKAYFNFMGVTDVTFIRAEGLAIPGQKDPAVAAAQAQIAALSA